MQRHWDHEDVIAHFTLTDEERALVQATRADHTCLGFAVLLTCFQVEGRFPTNRHDVPPAVVAFLAQQLEVAPECLDQYDRQGRVSHYHHAQIHERLGFREATVQDADDLTTRLQPTCARPMTVIVRASKPCSMTAAGPSAWNHQRLNG
ncbi:MAG: DUF4158 domain-containing protein [Chloroflexaceae bacterium]|nr:DUF4158 domain-containing protein [Chloroflexaceae bacterium]